MSRKKADRIIKSECCGVAIHWKNTREEISILRKSMLPYVLECYYICSGCKEQPCLVKK